MAAAPPASHPTQASLWYGIAGTVSPMPQRAESVASDGFSMVSGMSSTALPAYLTAVNPPPEYISKESALQATEASEHRASFSDPGGKTAAAESSVALVNAFLDKLLYDFLATARCTSLAALRPAVAEVLKRNLARDAIASAQADLEDLLALQESDDEDENDDDDHNDGGLHPPTREEKWNIEYAWKRMRLRVMMRSEKSEFDVDDDERYAQEEALVPPGHRFSKATGTVSLSTEIFVAGVLNHIADRLMSSAVDLAVARTRRRGLKGEASPALAETDHVLVQETDVEKAALNSPMDKLWRGWRKSLRMAGLSKSRTPSLSGASSPQITRRNSHQAAEGAHISTVFEEQTIARIADMHHPEHVLASNIPLPTTTNDKEEIEPPTVSRDSNGTSSQRSPQAPSHRSSQSFGAIPFSKYNKRFSVDDTSQEQRPSTSPAGTSSPFAGSPASLFNVAAQRLSKRTTTSTDATATPQVDAPGAWPASALPTPMVDDTTGGSMSEYYNQGLGIDMYSNEQGQARPGTSPIPTLDPSQLDRHYNADTTSGAEFRTHDASPSGSATPMNAAAVTSAGRGAMDNESSEHAQDRGEDKIVVERKSLGDMRALIPSQMQGETGAGLDTPTQDVPGRHGDGGAVDYNAQPRSNTTSAVISPTSITSTSLRTTHRMDRSTMARSPSPREVVPVAPRDAMSPTIPQQYSSGRDLVSSTTSPTWISEMRTRSPPMTMEENSRAASLTESGSPRDKPRGSTSQQSAATSRSSTRSPSDDLLRKRQASNVPESDKVESSFGRKGSANMRPVVRRPSQDATGKASPIVRSPLTSASITTAADFDTLVQNGGTVKFTLTPEAVRDETDGGFGHQTRFRARPNISKESIASADPAKKLASMDLQPARISTNNVSSPATAALPKDKQRRPSGSRQSPVTRSSPVARPSPHNLRDTSSGQQPREPTVQTSSTRDFADFIRTTGPDKEKNPVVPLVSARSMTSLKPAQSPGVGNGNSPRASTSGTDRARSLSNANARAPQQGAENAPPVPAMPSETVRSPRMGAVFSQTSARASPGPSLVARGAAGSESGDNNTDLIDFIRNGPATPGQRRIPKEVAPFRSTMDSEDFEAMGIADLSVKPMANDQGSHAQQNNGRLDTRAASVDSQTGFRHSPQSSANSRSALLANVSGSPMHTPASVPEESPVVSPVSRVSHLNVPGGSSAPPYKPERRRFRSKDPYPIDDSDEDDDELTALPKERRAEESLMEFLRNTEPPGDNAPKPLVSGGPAQARALMNKARANSINSLRAATSHSAHASTPPLRNNSSPPSSPPPTQYSSLRPASARSPSIASTTTTTRPAKITSHISSAGDYAPPKRRTSASSLGSGGPRREARSPARMAAHHVTATSDLADFLRSSGPPMSSPKPNPAPAPVVGAKGPKVERKMSTSAKFWRKKSYLDMP